MRSLEAIILAGGTGSRFGGGKLLAPFRGEALIAGALRAAASAPVERVSVVTGHDGQAVGAAVLEFGRRYPNLALRLVRADRYGEGMAATLSAGVNALASNVAGAFVFLGDMPLIPSAIPKTLAQQLGQRAAAAPTYMGERGHPVLFAARLFPALLKLTGDKGARSILDALGDDLALVAVDDAGVLYDVDQRSDLQP